MPASSEFRARRKAALAEAQSAGIYVLGLEELRKGVRDMSRAVDREVVRDLRVVARPVLATAKSLTPRLSGDLAASERISVRQRGVAFTSRKEYANVRHWGGTTGKGHRPGAAYSGSVQVEPALFLSRAVERHEDRIVDQLDQTVERLATRLAGFN